MLQLLKRAPEPVPALPPQTARVWRISAPGVFACEADGRLFSPAEGWMSESTITVPCPFCQHSHIYERHRR